MNRPKHGFFDRGAYISYLRFACRVHPRPGEIDYLARKYPQMSLGDGPLSPGEWDALTEYSVERHWKRWKLYISKRPELASWRGVEDDREGAWAKRKRPRRSDDAIMAEVFEVGLVIGELRKDGSVCPVRRRTGVSRGEALLSRTCRACSNYLPGTRFSKQKNGRRAICKTCDHKKRNERRKQRETPGR